jgi:hypothetical protein
VTFARAFADAGKDRDSRMLLDGRADQFHDEHGLADTGTAEHGGFAAFDERCKKVDNLDAGVKNLKTGTEPIDGRRRRMNGAIFGTSGKRRPAIDRHAQRIEDAPEHVVSNRHAD